MLELDEYSIWLEPKGIVQKNLTKIIVDLGTKNGSPLFNPHVTLLGGLKMSEEEIIKKMSILAKDTKALDILFEGIGLSDKYFKSVFIKCELNTALMDLNDKAQKLFSRANDYQPHLSLLYSNITNDKKELMLKSIPKELPSAAGFKASSMSLWHAKGTVNQWKKVAEMAFSS